jgi:hypothetical protein
LSTAALNQTVHTVAMTTLNKTLIAISVVVAAGLVYQTSLLDAQRNETSSLDQKISAQQALVRSLQETRYRHEELLAKKNRELEAGQRHASEAASVDADLEAWLGRVNRLKEWLEKMPEKSIPEMRLLTTNDWLAVTLNNHLQTEAKVRSALSDLRRKAKRKIMPNLLGALLLYSQVHGGNPPTNWAGLRPFLQTPLDEDILQRYDFGSEAGVTASAKPRLQTRKRGVLNEIAAVDSDYDELLHFSSTGMSWDPVSNLGDRVNAARQAFITAHNGDFPTDPGQLLPYFTTPVDKTRLKEFWDRGSP